MGLTPNAAYKVGTVQLEPEDVLLAYTDGVVDAVDKTGETFSKDRLTNLVTGSYDSAKTMIDTLATQVNDHNLGQEQFDDITIVALRREAFHETASRL